MVTEAVKLPLQLATLVVHLTVLLKAGTLEWTLAIISLGFRLVRNKYLNKSAFNSNYISA